MHMIPKLIAVIAVIAVVVLAPCVSAAATDARSDSLKAAYIYYFARFTDWKKTEKPNDGKVNLCAYTERDNLDKEFTSVANKSSTRRVSLQYRRIGDGEVLNNYLDRCHIIYIDESFPLSSSFNLETVLAMGVLFVTEKDVDNAKGIIRFVMNDKKLGFEIHRSLASKAKLKISSKLLSLATRLVE